MWRHEPTRPRPGGAHRHVRPYLLGIAAVALGIGLPALAVEDASTRADSGIVDLSGIPDSVLQRPRVVVLEVDPDELAELYRHPEERGRHWERIGRVAVLADGDVTFATRVGVRIHGGSSRRLPVKSLRLFFRPSLESVEPRGTELGLHGDEPYEALILHGDVRPDSGGLAYRYGNPISYDIASRLGVMVANTVPISLVVNGEPAMPYVLTEFLSPALLRRRTGATDLVMLNLRDDDDLERLQVEGPLIDLQRQFGPRESWTLAQIGTVVDVDNLSRWFLAVLFTGNRDVRQGMMVRDRAQPAGKWSWVAWDFDMSFRRREADWPVPTERFYFEWLLRQPGQVNGDARVVLLQHLFATSPEYRQQFAGLFVQARDSLLTPAFLESTLDTYARAGVAHGVTDFRDQALMRRFFAEWPKQLEAVLTEFLQVPLS